MNQKKIKSGFIAILGRPNAGKSTLLNALLQEKISIVSPVPQTTRFQLRGILQSEDAQLVFVDTPGIHLFKGKLSHHLNKVSLASLEGIDLILYVVDVSRRPGEEEKKIMDIMVRQKAKVIMALNKIDLSKKLIDLYIDLWREKVEQINKANPLAYYIPVSAKEEINTEKIKTALKELAPQGKPLYDESTLTDFPKRYRAADIIREKIFLKTQEEIPHSVAVEVKEIQEKERSVYVLASVYTRKDSQKKIIIGQGGKLIKEVGKDARRDLENIYKKKVYLELWVKTERDWQENRRILQDLGYWIN